jgi:two-component system response regulator HydG
MMSRRPSILIIDDDENIAKTFTAVLEKQGYSVDTAKDGGEAIKKLNTERYDVALVDIRLPDIDGIELLTKMKKTIPKTLRIIITGYPSVQNAIEAINKGADGYIVKPIDPEDLLAKIKEQLEKQGEEEKYTEDKVKEYIETRIRSLETEEK